MMGSPGYL
uniref:Uncharacterized protein n=1 Tax=Anguilla anguilla TaxID=7936 RepID=A0A0E9R5S3_ANGAN